MLALELLFLGMPRNPPVGVQRWAISWVDVLGDGEAPTGFGFVMNRDSWLFMRLTAKPSALMEPAAVLRRSRPLYVVLGSAIERPLRPLGTWIATHFEDGLHRRLTSAWLALVVLNLAALVGTVVAFEAFVCGSARSGFTTWCVAAVLVVNFVTRHFFWSPHTQTLNLLVPMLAVWLAWRTLHGEFATVRAAAGWGVTLGLGMLVYGNLPIALGSYAIALAITGAHPGSRRPAARIAIAAVAFAIPTLLWMQCVRWQLGAFDSGELRKNQFIWVLDALRLPGNEALAYIFEKFATYTSTLARVARFPVALLLGIAFARTVTGDRPAHGDLDRTRALAIGIVLGTTVTFQFLLGFYADRLTWSLVPPVLAAAAVLARPVDVRMRGLRRLAVRGALAATVAVWVSVQVLSGPAPGGCTSKDRRSCFLEQMRGDPRYGSIGIDPPPRAATGSHRTGGAVRLVGCADETRNGRLRLSQRLPMEASG